MIENATFFILGAMVPVLFWILSQEPEPKAMECQRIAGVLICVESPGNLPEEPETKSPNE